METRYAIGDYLRIFWPLDEQVYVCFIDKIDMDRRDKHYGTHRVRWLPDGAISWLRLDEGEHNAGYLVLERRAATDIIPSRKLLLETASNIGNRRRDRQTDLPHDER